MAWSEDWTGSNELRGNLEPYLAELQVALNERVDIEWPAGQARHNHEADVPDYINSSDKAVVDKNDNDTGRVTG